MFGKKNFMMKAFGLFMNCDNMLGKEFEKGLAQMKSAAETAPRASARELETATTRGETWSK